MTYIVYEAEIEVKLEAIRLNGEEGALEVYANQEAWDEADEVCYFENANAAYDFIDQFERALSDAGFRRSDEA